MESAQNDILRKDNEIIELIKPFCGFVVSQFEIQGLSVHFLHIGVALVIAQTQEYDKMAQEEKRLRLTLLVLVFVAFVVLVVGVATDYWGQSTRTTAIHYGLWKGCGAIGVSDKSPIRCFSPEDVRVAGK